MYKTLFSIAVDTLPPALRPAARPENDSGPKPQLTPTPPLDIGLRPACLNAALREEAKGCEEKGGEQPKRPK